MKKHNKYIKIKMNYRLNKINSNTKIYIIINRLNLLKPNYKLLNY